MFEEDVPSDGTRDRDHGQRDLHGQAEQDLGDLIRKAIQADDVRPSDAGVDWVEQHVEVPNFTQPSLEHLRRDYVTRLAAQLEFETGVGSLGALLESARKGQGWSLAEVASMVGVAAGVLTKLEMNTVPVWRVPANVFGQLCQLLRIEVGTLLSWSFVRAYSPSTGAWGRMDEDDETRDKILAAALSEADKDEMAQFSVWQEELSAYLSAPPADVAGPER